MSSKRGVVGGGGNMPLSRFAVVIAQLESIVASASQKSPDALLCFDLLSELSDALDSEPQETIQLWQRKCEDVLFSLLILGVRRPVRRLASAAMGRVIEKGDGISIYSRVSTLQGWLVDGKRAEPLACAGAAQCLGELYRLFGRRITGGLVETANIATKLMKFNEDFVRQEAMLLLENALEGSGGSGATTAYLEAFRIIMRTGLSDKSFMVRGAAAKCLKAFANIGGPGLGPSELDSSMTYCVKGLEDAISSVRDSFAEALGALLALAMNSDFQVKRGGKKQSVSTKKLNDGLQNFLILPFIKAIGVRVKEVKICLSLSWVFFLQTIHLKYSIPDTELQNYALQAIEILQGSGSTDPHILACVLYILRVGVADQMTEPTQRGFLVLLGRKLESNDCTPPMRVAILRMLSYLLTILGEVPADFKDVLDNTVVAALSNSSMQVRVEAALTIRALAEVDPTSVGGLISYGTTTLHALRESVSSERGCSAVELDSLHGQATVLAALVAISPKLLLGYPARLPISVLQVSKKMLNEFSRNPAAASVEREAGWLLLTSLLASMPKEELDDQVFDILLLWAGPFTGNPESYLRNVNDWASELRVLSVAMEALHAFIRRFITPTLPAADSAVLLNPVVAYLGGALSLISSLLTKQVPEVKAALDLFTTRTLMAYQSVANPMAYQSEHNHILNICSSPFSDPFGWEESSCLRFLLDKRDSCLGPWIPGRDSFEDELRAFDGGSDGPLPCVWDYEISSFPQAECTSKMLVNQMLLCFGTIFACQHDSGKIEHLNKIDRCLKTGKKQLWFLSCVTNICVGLLSALKAILSLGSQTLPEEVLSKFQSIFQVIIADTEFTSAQHRAACEGLGLLARVGNDIFTAKMARSLLGELALPAASSSYAGSIALSLGCIHRSAGGMALSTLVPSTVSSLCLLSKCSNTNVQLWSMHGLLLTIEAAGLSYISQVQATLFLAMEILLSEENGFVDIRQEIGHIINAIVAVLGPELAPGSTFFSRCKSAITEISSCKETATLLESVRFIQQLVLFAPQAVPVHSHVQGLITTLSSGQPSLRSLAVSTLHHLIERDPDAMIKENIEENFFSMLDEETDSEIATLVRATIIRLLYASCHSCPSRWLAILRNMVLATSPQRESSDSISRIANEPLTSTSGNDAQFGEDDEDMIASSKHGRKAVAGDLLRRNKHLRYRTRIFAAECLSHVPIAVGTEPAHFDLRLARRLMAEDPNSLNDWLVLKLQELLSLSYQISTGQFEGMQPIGVKLLSDIMDKFGKTADPEFPGHILLEQFQAQLVSAIRSAVTTASGPLLLEAGLELATKVITSKVVGGDRVALNRLFLLISRPLTDVEDLRYPSFADWVVCKIKTRLLTAHASVKCCTYQFFMRESDVPDEYQQLAPLLANNSVLLGKYWISVLKDYFFLSLGLQQNVNYKPFLDGFQSMLVSSKVKKYLDEAWPLILQATVLDAAPLDLEAEDSLEAFISGRSMIKLGRDGFQFLWGLSAYILFGVQSLSVDSPVKISFCNYNKENFGEFLLLGEDKRPSDVILRVFLSLTRYVFFVQGFLSVNVCQELLQGLLYASCTTALSITLFSQIVRLCPDSFFEDEEFVFSAIELCSRFCTIEFQSDGDDTDYGTNSSTSKLLHACEPLASRTKIEHMSIFALSIIATSYQSCKKVSTNACLSKVAFFLQNILFPLKKRYCDKIQHNEQKPNQNIFLQALVSLVSYLSAECINRMCTLENKLGQTSKVLAKTLVFCLGEAISLTKLVHEAGYSTENNGNDDDKLSYNLFINCVKVIQNSLDVENVQVQAIGVRVLRSVAQKGIAEVTEVKNNSSFLLLAAEILGDIFLLLQRTIQKCSSREQVTIIDDCLRLLVLFNTLAQETNCQKAMTALLLSALNMVFFISNDEDSQELGEVNSITRKMVSHLIQTPSAAAEIKDVMLSASRTQRQQLQDMIRASVGQAAAPVPANSTAQEQTVVASAENTQPVVARTDPDDATQSMEETAEEDQSDDDWDAFQSLPAAAAPDSSPTSQNEKELHTSPVSSSADSVNNVAASEESVQNKPRQTSDAHHDVEDDEFQDFEEASGEHPEVIVIPEQEEATTIPGAKHDEITVATSEQEGSLTDVLAPNASDRDHSPDNSGNSAEVVEHGETEQTHHLQ